MSKSRVIYRPIVWISNGVKIVWVKIEFTPDCPEYSKPDKLEMNLMALTKKTLLETVLSFAFELDTLTS